MLAAAICGKARIGKAATSGGLVGTILTASGTGVGHMTTGSSLGTRGCSNGYWHACYNHSGRIPLVEADADHLYLKGCSDLKGNFHTKGADKGTGKGISTLAVGLRGCANRMIRIQTISTVFC